MLEREAVTWGCVSQTAYESRWKDTQLIRLGFFFFE